MSATNRGATSRESDYYWTSSEAINAFFTIVGKKVANDGS